MKNVIKKWYYKLGFPHGMNTDFEQTLKNAELDETLTVEIYNTKERDGAKNLLYFLYFCESLEKKYREKGIPEKILTDTLSDIVIWTKTWSELEGRLYLGELEWLKRHLEGRLFRLGRLQFCMADSEFDIPEKGLVKGAPVVEVHIPEGEPLSREACISSLDMAREFFARYFPKFDYSLFTCHSWLLDNSLCEFLSPDSNILKFASLFTIAHNDPSDALFGYLFKWGAKREQLEALPPSSSLAAKVKEAAKNQRVFYESLGYIVK